MGVPMAVLVIGGAGFIGSHMAGRLLDEGEQIVVLDNLSTGFRDAVLGAFLPTAISVPRELLREVFRAYSIDTVMHFASFIQVGESVTAPSKYYVNNVANTLQLLSTMVECGVMNFVFSSSAAVYGSAGAALIGEDHPCAPINPYGRTKRIVEEALEDFSRGHGLNFISLRYFNAAGADRRGRIGERHNPETHLIPLVLQAASGRRDAITVFGRDYPTPDGTCVRDYVHVEDLCDAHLLGIASLEKRPSRRFLQSGKLSRVQRQRGYRGGAAGDRKADQGHGCGAAGWRSAGAGRGLRGDTARTWLAASKVGFGDHRRGCLAVGIAARPRLVSQRPSGDGPRLTESRHSGIFPPRTGRRGRNQ